MKKIVFLSGIGLFFFVQTAVSQIDTVILSLSDAIRIALSESPTIKVAHKEIERVDYAKKQRAGGLLPSISLSGAYQRAIKKQVMYMDGGAFDFSSMLEPLTVPMMEGIASTFVQAGVSPADFAANMAQAQQNYSNAHPAAESSGDGSITVGRDNTFQGGISATLPLIAPQLWASLKMSSLELEMANEQARSSKLTLINSVKKAYYNVLLAQETYRVMKRSYDNLTAVSEIDKKKFAQGTISEVVALQSEVAAKTMLPTVLQTQMGINLALLQLKVYMGVNLEQIFAVQGDLPSYEQTMFGDAMEISAETLSKNSDLRQLNIQAKQLEQNRKLNLAGRLPTLGAQFDYNYTSMVNDDAIFTKKQPWSPTSNLSLGLKIPLFSGGSNYYQDKQMKAQQQELELQRETLTNALSLQYQAAKENLRTAILQIQSSKETLKLAEKAVSISHKMYEVGVGTFIDLNTAEENLQKAGLGYNQAVANYLTTKADLEKLLGK